MKLVSAIRFFHIKLFRDKIFGEAKSSVTESVATEFFERERFLHQKVFSFGKLFYNSLSHLFWSRFDPVLVLFLIFFNIFLRLCLQISFNSVFCALCGLSC